MGKVCTYIYFLPLADVSDEPREAQQTDEAEQLGEAEDPQGPAHVEDLVARRVVVLHNDNSSFIKIFLKFGSTIQSSSVWFVSDITEI